MGFRGLELAETVYKKMYPYDVSPRALKESRSSLNTLELHLIQLFLNEFYAEENRHPNISFSAILVGSTVRSALQVPTYQVMNVHERKPSTNVFEDIDLVIFIHSNNQKDIVNATQFLYKTVPLLLKKISLDSIFDGQNSEAIILHQYMFTPELRVHLPRKSDPTKSELENMSEQAKDDRREYDRMSMRYGNHICNGASRSQEKYILKPTETSTPFAHEKIGYKIEFMNKRVLARPFHVTVFAPLYTHNKDDRLLETSVISKEQFMHFIQNPKTPENPSSKSPHYSVVKRFGRAPYEWY